MPSFRDQARMLADQFEGDVYRYGVSPRGRYRAFCEYREKVFSEYGRGIWIAIFLQMSDYAREVFVDAIEWSERNPVRARMIEHAATDKPKSRAYR